MAPDEAAIANLDGSAAAPTVEINNKFDVVALRRPGAVEVSNWSLTSGNVVKRGKAA